MGDPVNPVAEKGHPTALPELQSLVSHPSKITLKVILNRLIAPNEEIITEEKAGFSAKRSTTEQISNLRIISERYLQHQQNMYLIFVAF